MTAARARRGARDARAAAPAAARVADAAHDAATLAAIASILRATLRRATGAAGTLVAARAGGSARGGTPPLVVLCDISGSMDRYARMLLHFLHAITNDRDRVHVLLFGTRLTNITRHLQASRRRRRARARRRRRCRIGPAARGSAAASPTSTGAGRAGCSGRTPSCCSSATGSTPKRGEGLGAADGAAAQVLPPARLAESAAALRRLRGAAGGHPGDAAARRRLPAGAQSGKPDGACRSARSTTCRGAARKRRAPDGDGTDGDDQHPHRARAGRDGLGGAQRSGDAQGVHAGLRGDRARRRECVPDRAGGKGRTGRGEVQRTDAARRRRSAPRLHAVVRRAGRRRRVCERRGEGLARARRERRSDRAVLHRESAGRRQDRADRVRAWSTAPRKSSPTISSGAFPMPLRSQVGVAAGSPGARPSAAWVRWVAIALIVGIIVYLFSRMAK